MEKRSTTIYLPHLSHLRSSLVLQVSSTRMGKLHGHQEPLTKEDVFRRLRPGSSSRATALVRASGKLGGGGGGRNFGRQGLQWVLSFNRILGMFMFMLPTYVLEGMMLDAVRSSSHLDSYVSKPVQASKTVTLASLARNVPAALTCWRAGRRTAPGANSWPSRSVPIKKRDCA